jgi:hypothetical protein
MSKSLGAKRAAAMAGPLPRLRALRPGLLLWPALALVAVLAATVIELRWQGRLWWCSCGRPELYRGDTIANSLGDILSCVLGFVLARRLGLWGSIALFILTELILLLWTKDSLVLDILMLVHPIDSIKNWQLSP